MNETRSLFINIEISTRLAKYTFKSTAPGERKERYYRLVVKRKFLGREKRDINETCHITTAPEIESRALYDSIATVGEIRVYWRADFQSGSRVLKKVF